MRTLVIGFDGSADARRALDWALALALPPERHLLHLVHALGMPDVAGRPNAASLAQLIDEYEVEWHVALEREAARIRASGGTAEVFVRRWLPAETIVEHAAQVKASLVAVGTHGAGRARFLLGSVTSEVVRESSIPVLVARGSRPPRPPRRMLLCLDGSVHSLRAARVAASWGPGADLVALHVSGGRGALSPEELADAVSSLALGSRAVELQRVDGEPAERILERVGDGDFDLLSVGSRGLGPLAELLLGSVSDKLLQLAPCPVLLSR